MSNSLEGLMCASKMLLEVLATVNEAHLANFTRKTAPELELVKHVRKKLAARLGTEGRVFKSVKGLHEKYGKVTFLKQPDVDLPFLYRNTLHGVEFKLLRKGISFYSGLEEAISYSAYGIDYSWIIHFFRKSFRHRNNYEKWMRFVLEGSGCRSVGYITATAGTPKVVVFPKEQFSFGNEYELAEIVLRIRKKLFSNQ